MGEKICMNKLYHSNAYDDEQMVNIEPFQLVACEFEPPAHLIFTSTSSVYPTFNLRLTTAVILINSLLCFIVHMRKIERE